MNSQSTQLPLCASKEIDVFEATEACEAARRVEERGVSGASAPAAVPRVVSVDGGRQEIPGRDVIFRLIPLDSTTRTFGSDIVRRGCVKRA